MTWQVGSTSEQNSPWGGVFLGILRIALGWTMVWAFMDKMFGLGFPSTPDVAFVNGGSPTEYYLTYLVDGPFEGFWNSLTGNAVIDWLLMLGLIAVGVSMMLGVASKLSTIGFVVMMTLMFTLSVPPSDNPLLDYHVIYIIAALAVYWMGGYTGIGLGRRWSELAIVRRLPILG